MCCHNHYLIRFPSANFVFQTGKLSINGDHYGLTHFVTRLSHNYKGNKCGHWMIDSDGDGNADKYGLRGCVQTLNANDVLNVRSKISCWLG